MTERTSRGLLLAVVALLAVAGAVAPVAGQQAATENGSAPVTRSADLVVRQPGYVDGDVSVQTAGGRPVYSVAGERVWLKPENFDAGHVVEFGVDRGAGELAYDREMGAYTFSSEGEQASFTVYWIVLERVPVGAGGTATASTATPTPAANASGAGNATATATATATPAGTPAGTGGETAIQRVRYEAVVKVTGQASLDHLAAGELETLRAQADKWEEFNDTVQDVRDMDLLAFTLVRGGEPPSTEQIVNAMVGTYISTRDPLRLFTGGITDTIIILTMTVGGLAVLLILLVYPAWAMRKLRGALHRYKATESAEGEVADRIAAVEQREREQVLNNLDFQDFDWSDAEAAAYRSAGDTPRSAYEALASDVFTPETIVRDRLRAMHECGYRALVERDGDDGGDGDENEEAGEIVAAEVVGPITDGEFEYEHDHDEDVLEPLDDPDDALVRALWNDDEQLAFDVVGADYDPAAFDEPPATLSLDELTERVPMQVDRFEDEQALGRLIREHAAAVAASGYTTDEGVPRPERRALESFYATTQWLRDMHGLPSARLLAEHVERALMDFDPGREAERVAGEMNRGEYDG